MPASDDIKVGTKVEVTGKDWRGVVAFSGLTSFAAGKWVGVVLDQPNGKNNGSVQGKTYFSCQDNYGLFVRPTQLTILEEAPANVSSTPARSGTTKTPSKPTPSSGSKLQVPSKLGRTSAGGQSGMMKSTSTASLASDHGGAETEKRYQPMGLQYQKTLIKKEPCATPTSSPGPPPSVGEAKTVKSSPNNEEKPDPNEAVASAAAELAPVSVYLPPPGSATTDVPLAAENESMRAQIQDLTEKLNTLKVKRAEDREKLRDYGSLKMQAALVPDFKAKVSELQKDLQSAQKKAEDTEEQYKSKLEEFQDVGDTMEMLTLDKEMAEERCDTLKYENEALLMRVKELELDLKVIKEEIESRGTEGAASDYQFKQLEAQYNRQKEALLRLRDLMTQENAVKDSLAKENKRLEGIVTSLNAEKDKMASEKKTLEDNLGGLRETVDAAFGSEKMIDMLTARNLELEDRCAEQEEKIQELEELTEMNNEIEENFRLNEIELREDIDMKESELRALNTKAEHLIAVLSDRESTILKFRQLVQKLKEENETLKTSVPAEIPEESSTLSTSESSSMLAQQLGQTRSSILSNSFAVDLKAKQNNTQNLFKSLDCDLKTLEIKQLEENVSFIMSYLPDNFSRSAGNLDCIRASVLLPRLCEKIKILVRYVKMKNGAAEEVLDSQKSLDPSENPCFAFNVSLQLLGLYNLVTQVSFILNTCSVERYLRIGSVYPEMLVHEKSIDYLINLFKKDQLEDTVKFENINRAKSFFDQLLKAVFLGEKLNNSLMFENSISLIQECSECIHMSCDKIMSYLNPNLEFDDFAVYLKDTTQVGHDIKKLCRKVKKLFPSSSDKMLIVSDQVVKEVTDYLEMTTNHALVMYQVSREAEIASSVLNEGEFISSERICELRDQCVSELKINSYAHIKPVPNKVQGYMTQLCTLADEGEFDEVDSPKYSQPIYAHAEQTKVELANQTRTAEDADLKTAEIKEAKIKLRQKDEELASMNVKIELIEQKSKSVPKAMEEKTRMLKEENERIKEEFESAKRNHEITLSGLDQEIKDLEQQSRDLKAKVNQNTVKNLMGGISKFAINSTSKDEPSAKFIDSPFLKEEVASLKNALKFSQQEVWRLRGEKMKEKMDLLSPLPVLNKPIGLVSSTGLVKLDGGEKASALGNLTRQAVSLVSELDRLCVNPRVVNLANRKPGIVPAVDKLSSAQQMVAMKTHHMKVQNKLETLREKVLNFTANEYPLEDNSLGTRQSSLFANRKELERIKENMNPSLAAKIVLPVTKSAKPGTTKVFLSRQQFFELHRGILKQ